MSSKVNRTNRLESEIEKSREEGNWKKVIELAEQFKTRIGSGASETLSNFVIGEGKLELFLEESPSSELSELSAKDGLLEARHFLEMCTGDSSKKVEASLDALLLLAKLEFVCGNHQSALKRLNDAGLHHLSEKALPKRLLRIVAESYSIEALCLEKLYGQDSPSDYEEKMIKCFDTAADLALLYLQEQDKLVTSASTQSVQTVAGSTGSASPLPPNGYENKKMGSILESALQRMPVIHIKAGRMDGAIQRYRSLLSAVETSSTHHLRVTLSKQLAELLLRGYCDHSYSPPAPDKQRSSGSSLKSNDRVWRPQKYSSSNIFIPENVNEEIILLLLISEAMAAREAVLSQSPDFDVARSHAFNNAVSVQDLLCIVLARRRQFNILLEVFERSLKFSFKSPHVWTQFGLTLCCGRNLTRAIQVLKEAHRLTPHSTYICMMVAKICFQQLGKVEEGLEWVFNSLKSVEMPINSGRGSNGNSNLLAARCHLYLGIGYSMQAMHAHRHIEAISLWTKALEAFTRSQQMDGTDHLVEFYLALHYAHSRQLVEAAQHVKMALYLRPEHPQSLMLLTLVLSAQKNYEEALQLVNSAVEEYPEHLQLFYIKAYLEAEFLGYDVALVTAQKLLVLWNELYKDKLSDELDVDRQNIDAHSVFNMSDKDTVSMHAESVAASRVEAALSEVASSLSSYQPKAGPQHPWMLQIQIWLLTAHLYIKTNRLNEASQCIQEAASIFPHSHHIMFMRGELHESKNEFADALTLYHNALSINPYHTHSLRHMGLVYHYMGKNRLAEKTLLDAIQVDPFDHVAWYNLGKCTASLGQFETSSNCFATSLTIEASSPVLPFTSIPFAFD